MNIVNLYDNYNSYFNSDLKAIFEIFSKIAEKNDYKIYLIGGLVRDFLLGKKSLDIDISVEGNAIEFANILKNECNAKILSIHKNFGTAKIKIDGNEIDLASTRSESYPKKGHLPQVDEIGCALEKDILRRDFTINSLALSLNQQDFANLIDFVGGYKDLKAKQIKVLHKESFIDDPTRIIRALKYSARLGFELDKKTLKLQEDYLNNVNYDMCQKRIKQELQKTFDQNLKEAFEKFINQKIYKLITNKTIKKCAKNADKLLNIYQPKHMWIIYFGIIAVFEDETILEKLQLSKVEKEIIKNVKPLLKADLKNDLQIYTAFHTQKLETLLILANLGKEKEVIRYLNNLKQIKLSITGKDLINLGFKPSKNFNKIFDYILQEKLKNPKIKKQEEIKLIKARFSV